MWKNSLVFFNWNGIQTNQTLNGIALVTILAKNTSVVRELREKHGKQVCIPVGCVPPASWPYPIAVPVSWGSLSAFWGRSAILWHCVKTLEAVMKDLLQEAIIKGSPKIELIRRLCPVTKTSQTGNVETTKSASETTIAALLEEAVIFLLRDLDKVIRVG